MKCLFTKIQSNITICAIHLNTICNIALTLIVSLILGHLFIRKGHNSYTGRNFQYRYIVNPQHWKVNYLKDSLRMYVGCLVLVTSCINHTVKLRCNFTLAREKFTCILEKFTHTRIELLMQDY